MKLNSFKIKDATLKPTHSFNVQARILHKKYYNDHSSFLSPIDLALGWGIMNKQDHLDKLYISQSNRWWKYKWNSSNKPEYNDKQIMRSATNTHLIPSHEIIWELLKSSEKDDIIQLSGYLVNIDMPNGGHWNSSKTRSDKEMGLVKLYMSQNLIFLTI